MNIGKYALSTVKAIAVFFGWCMGVLISAAKPETGDRPQGDGSDLLGEYNFRTGKSDSGADPNGWYEDDI